MNTEATRGESDPPAGASGRESGQESLAALLGGRRGAVDATVPPLAFVGAWLVFDRSVVAAAVVAVVTAAAIAGWRLYRRQRPRAAVIGLLGVAVGATVALYTGRAADFFLAQIAVNATSALAWLASIIIRWPLLGVIVGAVLGQKRRWRRDPALLRAYRLGSWVWVGQYAVRLAVFIPLWWVDQVLALGAARAVLSWPLVALCLAVSWAVVRRALPAGHPGLRHPVTPG